MENALCPYCGKQTSVALPGDYEPVYANCEVCGIKFIVERLSKGFHALRTEGAPCLSDPEWRAAEMAAGDEE